MARAKYGDEVKVHYTGKLTSGRVFVSSIDSDPMVLTIGQEKMFFDFEQALIGMSPGESKTITVSSDRALGPYREDLVTKVASRNIAPELKPEVGQRVEASHGYGNKAIVATTAVTDTGVTVDGNHPLAGQDLSFDLELVEIT
jgi:peptidylprolyl isomerase